MQPGDQYLLLPGPTQVPERVMRAMSSPMINHRGPKFKLLLEEVLEGIKQIHQSSGQVLIYPASGTGAMEAAVVNFISPGDRVLAVSIGAFGNRFAEIASRFGAEVEKLDFEWGCPADPEAIRKRLEEDEKRTIKAVLITHNETSTGVFNDLARIRALTSWHPALFLVDAVSSLAAIELKMDEWKLDVVVSGSQKAFMIPPGLSFLAYNEKAFEVYKQNKNHRFYWDIDFALRYLCKGQTPVTPPISLYFGMHEALKMMMEEGVSNVIARHYGYRDLVRTSAQAMGLNLLAADECASTAVTAVVAPPALGANKIRQYMLENFNIVLAGGQEHLDNVIFRIGHLGYVRELDLLTVVAALEITMRHFDYEGRMGAGVTAAQNCLLSKYR